MFAFLSFDSICMLIGLDFNTCNRKWLGNLFRHRISVFSAALNKELGE